MVRVLSENDFAQKESKENHQDREKQNSKTREYRKKWVLHGNPSCRWPLTTGH